MSAGVEAEQADKRCFSVQTLIFNDEQEVESGASMGTEPGHSNGEDAPAGSAAVC